MGLGQRQFRIQVVGTLGLGLATAIGKEDGGDGVGLEVRECFGSSWDGV